MTSVIIIIIIVIMISSRWNLRSKRAGGSHLSADNAELDHLVNIRKHF